MPHTHCACTGGQQQRRQLITPLDGSEGEGFEPSLNPNRAGTGAQPTSTRKAEHREDVKGAAQGTSLLHKQQQQKQQHPRSVSPAGLASVGVSSSAVAAAAAGKAAGQHRDVQGTAEGEGGSRRGRMLRTPRKRRLPARYEQVDIKRQGISAVLMDWLCVLTVAMGRQLR
eukprot:1159047-Pelagomonas_calceolata.AAC.13